MKTWLWLGALTVLGVGVLSGTESTQAKREVANARLREAIAATTRLESPVSQVAVLAQAGSALAKGCEDSCRPLLQSVYEKIIAPAGLVSAKPDLIVDKDALFRRFVAVVAHYDPKLAAQYVKDFRQRNEDSKQELYLWAAAYDILDADLPGSVRLASLAAQSYSFPDIALLYLEKLRLRSPTEADAVASISADRVPGLSDNARLQLLAYALPSSRIPEIIGDSLFNKEIPERKALPGGVSGALVAKLVRSIAAAPARGQKSELFVLGILEERLRDTYPALLPAVQQARARVGEQISAQDVQKSSAEVERWSAAKDFLQDSIGGAETAFQKSKEEKYRNRATLLRALAASRTGDYAGALALLSSLPLEARGNATDAVLLYAANAVAQYDQASNLAQIARAETRNRFVLGYALLTAARFGVEKAGEPRLQAANLLAEIDQISQELRVPTERFSLKVGVAMLWVRLDATRAQTELASILKEMNEVPTDGVPNVHLIIAIPGTRVEYKLPAGTATLYDLIKNLARRNLEATLASASFAARDELRLRCIVAASAEYLAFTGTKQK
jgi:hypothetical protein